MVEDVSQSFVSPLFFVGIIIFILPVVTVFFKFQLPAWTYSIGLAVILIGAVHTVWKRRQQ
jgi:hypothetical protein